MRGPYDSSVKKVAQCICRIKRERGEVQLKANHLSEECSIHPNTARDYVDSTKAETYQIDVNENLRKTCKNTQIKRIKITEYGVLVDDPEPVEKSRSELEQKMELKNDFDQSLKRVEQAINRSIAVDLSNNPAKASKQRGTLRQKPILTWLESRPTLVLDRPILARFHDTDNVDR